MSVAVGKRKCKAIAQCSSRSSTRAFRYRTRRLSLAAALLIPFSPDKSEQQTKESLRGLDDLREKEDEPGVVRPLDLGEPGVMRAVIL